MYPQVKRQRCWAHKLRNVANYLKKKDIDACIKEARLIYKAENRAEALKEYKQWAEKWASISPKAVRCIQKDLQELLNFYYCPKEIRIKVRTTNVIERAFREVRLRTDAAKRFKKVQNATAMIWKLLQVAEKNFRTLKGYWLLSDVYAEKKFADEVMKDESKVTERMAA
jgi:transposase-like protein